MDVYFVNLSKRQNSTYKWTPTGDPTYTGVKLKAPCTVLKPVIEILLPSQSDYSNLIRYNYAYIPALRRYYHVTNWTLANAKALVSMEVDVLATYSDSIKASNQYVLRSASIYDSNIIDTKYPIKTAAPTVRYLSVANPLQPASNNYGCFVVGIINREGSLMGAVTYYLMSYLVFMNFSRQLFTLSNQWGTDTTVSDGIKKALTDPFQYVVSCMWLPYSTADFSSRGLVQATSTVVVGYDAITITGTGYYFDDSVLNIEFTNLISFTLSNFAHPSASSRGEFLNKAPYTRYYLSFYPFCGEIELDSSRIVSADTLSLVYTVDLRTGKGVLNVCTSYTGTSYLDWKPVTPLRVIEAQIGVNIPLANIHTVLPTSLGSMGRSVVSAATGVAEIAAESGGWQGVLKRFASTVAGWQGKLLGLSGEQIEAVQENIGAEPFSKADASNIAGNAAAATSSAELIGSQGTISLNSRMPLQFWSVCYPVANDSYGLFGRPYCQEVTLSTLSGYCLCADPHILAPLYSMPAEVAEINNYLATGVFLE